MKRRMTKKKYNEISREIEIRVYPDEEIIFSPEDMSIKVPFHLIYKNYREKLYVKVKHTNPIYNNVFYGDNERVELVYNNLSKDVLIKARKKQLLDEYHKHEKKR